ncbi:MAG: glutathione peroxidase [Gemmataceae bacterium]|nr:glutathione peroxidase [Gemmataceae bacterium]MDW8265259.1 glutathione peroxidase [Gemmataceae bacterium]
MRRSYCLVVLVMLVVPLYAADKEASKVPAVLNFKMTSLSGQPVNLAKYQGKVVLIVNVASECGLTPQYKGLQELHRRFAPDGLAILGFPANEFGGQEPGTNAQIAEFCKKNYGVEFDMFAKVVVKGEGQCPLYRFLTSKETNPKFGGDVTWNFEKFLISRKGEIVARFSPETEPTSDEVVNAIKAELAKAP